MIRWEYMIGEPPAQEHSDGMGGTYSITSDWHSTDADTNRWLNELGQQGWKLIAIKDNSGVFKRPIANPARKKARQ